ncbi:MAG: hypothetical protein Q8859_03870, partial [Bacteroidota bacterium]|nr:hypothetical protein [Bacteroidota bacterium]
NLKITGYLQFQYQKADSMGINSMAGGNFSKFSDSRFMTRRGRIKFAYSQGLAEYVLQFDATESGFAIKDAYLALKDPYLNAFSFTGGVFNRPFGFEIAYSSSKRESPERARIIQTLFPKERDLGGMVSFQMPKTSPWNFLRLDAGLFSGNGTNAETDSRKDFIGHLTASKSIANDKIKFGLGASLYNGFVFQPTANVYEMAGTSFVAKSGVVANSYANRQYWGLDGQLTVESALGYTTLRGEYVAGKQPGTSSSSASPTALPTADTYIRNVAGGYVYFIQTLGQSAHSIVVKYDLYDPNTKVSGNEIGMAVPAGAKATGAGDLKYTTWGLGWLWAVTPVVKFTAYYDIVKNETSNNVKSFSKDLKDNVLTLRLQYRF